ncbi:hypothetical protein BaRGS_00026125 [Batillaria attramentaria]|uniref:G-protein coupled receptors family 1 profile domain-containing protein n=1 Tax=Batillaria attramentaria TaxID=370345 RepID=A0ABD0K707_9CAEN
MASTPDEENMFMLGTTDTITTATYDNGTESSLQLTEWGTADKIRNTMIGTVLVLVNALTLISLVRTRSFRPHTKVLVGSLTCTDMLMGIITLLPRLLPWQNLSHEPMCVVRFSGVFMSVFGTCLSITSVTLDRMMALTFPIVYRTSVTVNKSLAVVATVWGLSALLTVFSLVGGFPPNTSCDLLLVTSTRGLLTQALVELLSVVAITTLYIYIGMRLRRRRRRIQTELSSRLRAPTAAAETGDLLVTPMKSEKRTTVTAMVLAVCFLLGYLPVSGYLLWVVQSGVDRFEEARKQRLLVLIACPLINSILDPLVYFWRLQDWRAVILGRCREWRKSRARRGDSSSAQTVATTGASTAATRQTAA